MSIGSIAKTVVDGAKARQPEIMIGAGLIMGAGAIFAAAKETPKCLETFERAKAEKPVLDVEMADGSVEQIQEPLELKEKVVIFFKSYWIAMLLEAGSIFLIVRGHKIRLDGHIAAMALCGIYQAERDDLKKVIAAHSESWRKKFDEKAAEVHMDETNPSDVPPERMSNTEVPMPLPLFWDDQARVYFRLSDEDLRDAVAEITHRISTDPFQSTTMNEWMEIIGHEDVVDGDYRLFVNDQYGVPIKYQQIGVKESPTGEPARSMKFNIDYVLDTRGMYCNN